MARKKKKNPKAGDMVLVEWQDIYENPTGSTASAKPARLISLAYFVEWRGRGQQRQLITTNCFDLDTNEPFGCCSYPAGVVISITLVADSK